MLSATLTLDALKLAVAIVLDAMALIVWDVGTRSPLRLLADLRVGLRQKSSIAAGSVRFTLGALALAAGLVLSAQVATRAIDVTILGCLALFTGLMLEQLVGPILRRR